MTRLARKIGHRLRTFKWYDAPNWALNRVLAPDSAVCHTLDYGEAVRQQLDLYVPHQPRPDRALLVFVHGGSWQQGDKADYVFLGQHFASAGYYVAIVQYRLAPMHGYADFVADAILAINWLHEPAQAAQFGYAPERTILMGHSAGAFNIAAALYHDQSIMPLHLTHVPYIRAMIGIAGPYSFDHRGDPIAQHALPQDVPPSAIMPDNFIFKNSIRHLLLVAQTDHLVGPVNSERLADALRKAGNDVTFRRIPRSNHITIIATLSRGFSRLFATDRLVQEFMQQALLDTPAA